MLGSVLSVRIRMRAGVVDVVMVSMASVRRGLEGLVVRFIHE